MKLLIQRVLEASITINKECIASCQQGLLVFIGFEPSDSYQVSKQMVLRLLSYRIFEDSNGKMNNSVQDINGDILIAPQFTLTADTKKGLRPSFSTCMAPDKAKDMFEHFISLAKEEYPRISSGNFGADMKIKLINDGPVTFLLES